MEDRVLPWKSENLRNVSKFLFRMVEKTNMKFEIIEMRRETCFHVVWTLPKRNIIEWEKMRHTPEMNEKKNFLKPKQITEKGKKTDMGKNLFL